MPPSFHNMPKLITCAMLGGITLLAGLAQGAEPLKVLFLGDNGHHRPADRFPQLQGVLAERGIQLTYTDKVDDLNADTLAKYAGLMIYANITQISPAQEKALLEYVEGGRGLIPLHCASYCFLNSPKYIELVGAQFKRHGTGTFRTEVDGQHPLMKGFGGFESWDETYVHHQHNEKNRLVLEYRQEGESREPWTWVRTQGKGRVFYTAWGHDARTWGHPGFHNLVERGIHWATGGDAGVVPAYADRPAMTAPRKDVKPFEYVTAKVPYYPAGQGWGKTEDSSTKMQLPVAAEESLKHYVTPVGFELRLFAAEPEIGKPICMNWDERGRLWICETMDYPNEMQNPGQGRDRIRICEDTTGDGRADKFTIFAEKLSIPTSLTFARGGVIVHQAPHTLFLKDTTGDDVADVREVLFSGWATNDTHAGPSNLQYGFDNWIYGMVGYAGFQGTVGGETHNFRTGFYRFKSDGSKLEFLRNTNNNSWGVGFSEEGLLFGSTANGNPSVYLPIPNRYYERVRGWSSTVLGGIASSAKYEPITSKIRQVDHHGNFTAAAGHALYTARQYPANYWNRTAFVNGPTGHLLATFVLQAEGADFRSQNSWNLAASDDEWAAPIMAEVGPDGNVWMLDWYNYIVQHNPTPPGFKTGKGNAYETDLRDKRHGRIYRVVYTPSPAAPRMSLHQASAETLVAALTHDNLFWRRHAQRLLVERGQTDVVPSLIALTQHQEMDAVGLNVGAIHALWTLDGLGSIAPETPAFSAVQAALQHPSPAVRRTALMVLPRHEVSLNSLLSTGVLQDANAQVRLAALLFLADLPPQAAAANALVKFVFSDSTTLNDRWLREAATSAAATHDAAFLSAVINKETKLANLSAVGEVLAQVSEHYARNMPREGAAELIALLPQANTQASEAMLAGFAKGWPKGQKVELDEATQQALLSWFDRLTPAARSQLVLLAGTWGSKALEQFVVEVAQGFLQQVRDEKLSDPARLSAAQQLIEFRRQEAKPAEEILELLSPRLSPALSDGLLEAVGRSQASSVGQAVVECLPMATPGVRKTAVGILLSRADWSAALVEGLEQGKLQLAELSLDQKQALATHPDRSLSNRAKKLLAAGGGLPNPDRQKVLAELLNLTEKTGDPAAGKLVFTKHCAKCHRHTGEGQQIGPDLTGMAVHPKAELLTHIIDPSKNVEGNFRMYTLVIDDGRIMNGLLASETKTAVELYDAEGKKHVVLREQIEQLAASTKSLMPEGFEKQATPDELTNLLEFLTQRGKYLPLPLAKACTIVSTEGMFFSKESQAERLIFADWSPKTFAGVPFHLVDPQAGRVPNVILLYGPNGQFPPKMPKSVSVPCNAPAKTIHMLSGVSGWGYPLGQKGSVSLIVRLHYADGKTEDHELKNGLHFADYIRRVDVPESQFAFSLRSQQLRYLQVHPLRSQPISHLEFLKGTDSTAPIIVSVTLELSSQQPMHQN